jgi:hypothetical protein
MPVSMSSPFKYIMKAEELRKMSKRDATIAIVKALILIKRVRVREKMIAEQQETIKAYQTINSCSL